ncbi:MAG: hypothetical protein ABSG71_14915 [Thermodesulfobacteriota bacterium]
MREAIVNYVKWAIVRFPFEEPILDTCAGWEPNFYQPLFPGKQYIKQDMRDFDPSSLNISLILKRRSMKSIVSFSPTGF